MRYATVHSHLERWVADTYAVADQAESRQWRAGVEVYLPCPVPKREKLQLRRNMEAWPSG